MSRNLPCISSQDLYANQRSIYPSDLGVPVNSLQYGHLLDNHTLSSLPKVILSSPYAGGVPYHSHYTTLPHVQNLSPRLLAVQQHNSLVRHMLPDEKYPENPYSFQSLPPLQGNYGPSPTYAHQSTSPNHPAELYGDYGHATSMLPQKIHAEQNVESGHATSMRPQKIHAEQNVESGHATSIQPSNQYAEKTGDVITSQGDKLPTEDVMTSQGDKLPTEDVVTSQGDKLPSGSKGAKENSDIYAKRQRRLSGQIPLIMGPKLAPLAELDDSISGGDSSLVSSSDNNVRMSPSNSSTPPPPLVELSHCQKEENSLISFESNERKSSDSIQGERNDRSSDSELQGGSQIITDNNNSHELNRSESQESSNVSTAESIIDLTKSEVDKQLDYSNPDPEKEEDESSLQIYNELDEAFTSLDAEINTLEKDMNGSNSL